jgi:hypothetical protein
VVGSPQVVSPVPVDADAIQRAPTILLTDARSRLPQDLLEARAVSGHGAAL